MSESSIIELRMKRIRVANLVSSLRFTIFGKELNIGLENDQVYVDVHTGLSRMYIVVSYTDRCRVSGEDTSFRGRKWYLSDFMTDDEVIKTAYAACRAAVEHEVMEGFTFQDQIVFNPHTPYTTLIESSKITIRR